MKTKDIYKNIKDLRDIIDNFDYAFGESNWNSKVSEQSFESFKERIKEYLETSQ